MLAGQAARGGVSNMNRIAFRYALSVLVGLSACHCSRATPEAARSSPARSAAAKKSSELATARELAVSESPGRAPVDAELAKLRALAQAQPRRLSTFIELGRAWVRKARESNDPGYYLNADACVSVALDIAPDDPLALDLRALVLLNGHEFAEAKRLAESLLARHPDSAMAWGSLSDASLELGEQDVAEQAALRMLDLKPNLPSYSRASYLRWLRGDTSYALELARLAIDASADPRQPEPRAWMLVQAALIFWHAGDAVGADAGFREALAVVADYPPALVGRGRVALAEGNPAQAAALFGSAYEKSPLTETAWLLGQARELSGDSALAAAAYADAEREGRRSDPRTLSLMWSTQKREPSAALSLAERERRLRGDIYTEDVLAFALYRVGRYSEAAQVIERARRLGTPDARLLFHEGAIRLALGERKRGSQLLRRALAQNPHFDEFGAREAFELLRSSS
jgi:tetratricopeptide (TPR) repeat protein